MIHAIRIRRSLALLLLAAFAALSAAAGDFNTIDGVALRGHDPVAYFTQGKPARGDPALHAKHRGVSYHFSSAAHRDAFLAQPDRYRPQYGGFCAYGTARGYKADADPAAFSIVDGKLYVNYNAKVREDWLKEPARYIQLGDGKWDEVRRIDKVLR